MPVFFPKISPAEIFRVISQKILQTRSVPSGADAREISFSFFIFINCSSLASSRCLIFSIYNLLIDLRLFIALRLLIVLGLLKFLRLFIVLGLLNVLVLGF